MSSKRNIPPAPITVGGVGGTPRKAPTGQTTAQALSRTSSMQGKGSNDQKVVSESSWKSKQLSMSNQKLVESIEGYSFPTSTPFGRVLSISADLYSFGRSLREIENHISSFIRPFTSYTTRRHEFADKIREHSRKNIIEIFGCTPSSHECIFLPAGQEMEPQRRILKLLMSSVHQTDSPTAKVNVYLQDNQSYDRIVPWMMHPEKIRVIPLQSDESGKIKTSTIVSSVLKNAEKAKHHIIQLTVESSKTKEKLDLTAILGQIEALRQEYPTHSFNCVLEATPLISSPGHTQKDIEEALSFFDYCVFRMTRLIGGQLASNFIIAKKQKIIQQQMQQKLPYRHQSISQVNAIKWQQALEAKTSAIIGMRDVEPTSIFRTAQVIEFYKETDLITRIGQSENSKLFFEEIQSINQRLLEISVLNRIDIGNIAKPSENGRYSVLIMQENSETFLEAESRGYPVLPAAHLAQLLHDLFGIQVKSNRAVKSVQNTMRYSNFPKIAMEELGITNEKEHGLVELNSSGVDIDIHFLLDEQEVLYIAAALELLTMYSPKIMKFYNKNLLKPKLYHPFEVDLTFKACAAFKHQEANIADRGAVYTAQLIEAAKILKAPQNYFTISETWIEEKSIVFPLSAFPNAFPTKSNERTTNGEGDGEDSEDNDSDDDNNLSSNRSLKINMSNALGMG